MMTKKSIINFYSLRIALIFLAVYFSNLCGAQNNLTAESVLDHTAKKLSPNTGTSIDFNIKANGINGKGELKMYQGKYFISLPDIKVWYNGKEMYTYNCHSGETTLINPTQEELYETNPLLYITGYKSKFTSAFSSEKKSGKYVIDLIPKGKHLDVKKITMEIKTTDFHPEKINIVLTNGSNVEFNITHLKQGPISSTEFDYPKNKYSSIQIIDLR